MKRFIQTGIVIGTAFVLWQVSADARFLDLKKQEQAPASVPQTIPIPQPPVPSYNSEVEPQGISLRFENLALINVLRNIQEETGILFSIDPSLEAIPFSATVQADNWEAAVRELLKGFSRVEVWTSNLETSRIWILSGQGYIQEPPNANIRLSRQAQPKVQPKRQPRFRTAPAPKPVVTSNNRIEDRCRSIRAPPFAAQESGVVVGPGNALVLFPFAG